MAEGYEPYKNSMVVNVIDSTGSTTHTITCSNPYERHFVIIFGSKYNQKGVILINTAGTGQASVTKMGGNLDDITFTEGNYTITLAHTNGSLSFYDFVLQGIPFTIS